MGRTIILLIASALTACASIDEKEFIGNWTSGPGNDPVVTDDVVASEGARVIAQAVVARLQLPARATDYALPDADGTPRNRFAALIGVLRALAPELELQPVFDALARSARMGTVLELVARSADDDSAARLRIWSAVRIWGDRSEREGPPLFMATPADGPAIELRAQLRLGQLSTDPASIALPLLRGADGRRGPLLPLRAARVRGLVRDEIVSDGVLTAAIAPEDFRQLILAEAVEPIEAVYRASTTSTRTKQMLAALFDGDHDGRITREEVTSGNAAAIALLPDVDTDGDGAPDALSFGIGFGTGRCQLIYGRGPLR